MTCHQCGKNLKQCSNFCPDCGVALGDPVAVSAPNIKEKRAWNQWLLPVLVAVLLAILLGVMGFFWLEGLQ